MNRCDPFDGAGGPCSNSECLSGRHDDGAHRAQAVALRAEAARQNQELKSTLLDALAHEFKTPLTSIQAAALGMLHTGDSPQTELRGMVEEETDRLDSLVNEAIQMTRIEAGQVQLERQPQHVSDLVASAYGRSAARCRTGRYGWKSQRICPPIRTEPWVGYRFAAE